MKTFVPLIGCSIRAFVLLRLSYCTAQSSWQQFDAPVATSSWAQRYFYQHSWERYPVRHFKLPLFLEVRTTVSWKAAITHNSVEDVGSHIGLLQLIFVRKPYICHLIGWPTKWELRQSCIKLAHKVTWINQFDILPEKVPQLALCNYPYWGNIPVFGWCECFNGFKIIELSYYEFRRRQLLLLSNTRAGCCREKLCYTENKGRFVLLNSLLLSFFRQRRPDVFIQ